MTILVGDLGQPEGPFAFPDGRIVLVEMAPDRGCVTEIGPGGAWRRTIARTGRPNAVVADAAGNLWVAESHPRPALLRISGSGEVDVVTSGSPHEPLRFPNDLVFAPDGYLYLTDSGIRLDDWAPGGTIRPDYRTAPIDGRVLRIDTESGEAETVDANLAFANGIAVSPAGDLYANEMISGAVYRYPWSPTDGAYGPREPFAQVLGGNPAANCQGQFRGPDGMKFAADGTLYCTVYGAGHLAVIDPSGALRDPLVTLGRLPSNLAFAADGTRKMYVTECELGQVEVFEVDTSGGPVHDDRRRQAAGKTPGRSRD